jgi:hypothetical protein
MSPFYRGLVKWTRTVHLYTTLFSLALTLFFAVTGFMLNHEDWFNTDDPRTDTRTGIVPAALFRGPDKLAIVELLRQDYGATGALDLFEEEEESFRVVFQAPGRRVEATIQRYTGKAEVTSETRGLAGIFLDLHRGKATGKVWGLVIDAVAVVLLIVSSTGLVLWWSLRGRGRYGLAVLGLGVALGVAVFILCVP